MKKTILLFCLSLCYLLVQAQALNCAFERLFTIQPGMDKLSVMGAINKAYKLQPVIQSVDKLPPYAKTGGDSIVKEIMVYKIDSSACFTGRNSRLQLEFADNKLYKAYISTDYAKKDRQEMIDNFNALRNTIKPKWKFENEVKLSGGNVMGFGYDYTKTKQVTDKTEKVSLQYVDSNVDNPANGNYILEVLWVNLANTRMERSTY